MIRCNVVLSPEANANLTALYDWIAGQASPGVALGYIERLEACVRGLDLASERGTKRDDVRPDCELSGLSAGLQVPLLLEMIW